MKKNNQRKGVQKALGVLLALVLIFGVMSPQVGAVYAENTETIEDTAESTQESQTEEMQTDTDAETQTTDAIDESSETKSSETEEDAAGLPEDWYPGMGSRANNNGGEDITNYITWSNAALQVYVDGAWVDVPTSGSVFPSYYNQYAFTIDWKVVGSSINDLDAGDYFTFTVPTPFAPGTIPMYAPDGVTVLGTIYIDSDGNAKAVFNSNVETLQEMWGSITISGTYAEEDEGESVSWSFKFGTLTFRYRGTAKGYDDDSAIGDANLYKYGYSDDAGTAAWVIRLNQAQQANWDGGATVTVTDTFGDGYVLDAFENHDTSTCSGSCIDHAWGIYAADTAGYTDHAYFEIIVVDWNAIRADYLAANPGSTIGPNEINEAMVQMKWDFYRGKPKYITFLSASDIESIEVTADGFEVILADGVLDGKSIEISCYVKVTSLQTTVTVANSVTALTYSDSDSTAVAGAATAQGITGKEGEILIYKQNANATQTLPGATFTLTRDDGVFSYDPQTTDAGGKVTFVLNRSYDGTYTLQETAAPGGYVAGEPITLKLDSSGYIIAVNGQTISANDDGTVIYDTEGNKLCWISGNRLWLIIYNEEATTGSFTVTKTDASTGSVLPGAEFILYYLDNGTKYYYTASGTWDTDVSNAKPLTTDDASGEISVTDIPYNTYYLQETKAPAGYILDQTPIVIEVKDSTATVKKTISNAPIKPIEVTLEGTKTLTGKTLADDMFSFTIKNSAGTEVAAGTNKADGTIEFTPIPYTYLDIGQTYTYTVKEVTGTDSGIIYDETSYTVTVTISLGSNGELQADIGYPTGGIVFNNTSKGSMNFQKVDAKDTTKTLEGAEFSLYKCDDATHSTASDHDDLADPGTCWQLVEADVGSDSDGYFGFDDLLSGIYLLVETTAPNGYQLPEGRWIITFDMTDGIQSIVASGSTSGTLAMKQAAAGSGADYLVLNLSVENYEMPMAGSTGVYRLMVGGCLLIACSLMGAGMLWKRKRKPSGS